MIALENELSSHFERKQHIISDFDLKLTASACDMENIINLPDVLNCLTPCARDGEVTKNSLSHHEHRTDINAEFRYVGIMASNVVK